MATSRKGKKERDNRAIRKIMDREEKFYRAMIESEMDPKMDFLDYFDQSESRRLGLRR